MTATKKQTSALVTFSGGQDSTTILAWAKNNFDYVEAISFNYGQQHSIELEQGAKICEKLGIKRTLVDISFMKDICDSALTSQAGNVNVPHSRLKSLPASFVPNRNLLLLTLSNTYAQKVGIENIITGTCETDYSGYPDCRRLFIDSLESTLTAASSKLPTTIESIRAILTIYNTTYDSSKEEPRILIEEYETVLEQINNFFNNTGKLDKGREQLVFEGVETCSYIYNLLEGTDNMRELSTRDDFTQFVSKHKDSFNTVNRFAVTSDEDNFFVKIHTPLMYLNKAETFQLAEQEDALDLVIQDSHTCYKGDRAVMHNWGAGCGECPACVLRKKGYEEYLELKKTK